MFNRYSLTLFAALALVLGACASATEPKPTSVPTAAPAAPSAPAAPTAAPKPAAISFSKDVLPILQSRCVQCHGGARTSAGIDLRTYASLQAAQVVTPGKASASKLVEVVVNGLMPKQGPKLTPAEIKTISDWVDAGAPDN